MPEPNLITSGLSTSVKCEGQILSIEIYRLENNDEWSLEVVDEEGTSTVWDDLFASDQEAFDEAMKAITEEGLQAFRINSNVVPFRR